MSCGGLLERLNEVHKRRLRTELLKTLGKEQNDLFRLELIEDVLEVLNGGNA